MCFSFDLFVGAPPPAVQSASRVERTAQSSDFTSLTQFIFLERSYEDTKDTLCEQTNFLLLRMWDYKYFNVVSTQIS